MELVVYDSDTLNSASTPRTITFVWASPFDDPPDDPLGDAIDRVRAELAACDDALPHFAPFTPPPASLPPLTHQPAPSDPPQRRRHHRIQARAPPATSGEYFTYPPPPKD